MTGIGQLDAACSISMIPAPLRVSSPEVAGILKRETSVRDVILAATAADVAVVGIGAVNQRRDGHHTAIRLYQRRGTADVCP